MHVASMSLTLSLLRLEDDNGQAHGFVYLQKGPGMDLMDILIAVVQLESYLD